MEDTKPWYASKNVWLSILQVGLGIATSLGWFSQGAADAILANGPELLAGLGITVVGGLQIYTRVQATKQLTA